MNINEEINQLERYVLSDNKENFIKKLIADTESFYFFSLLSALDKYGIELPKEHERSLSNYKKLKNNKSKGIALRYLFKKYDLVKDQNER